MKIRKHTDRKKVTRIKRHARIRAKIAGTQNRPRLVVFKSNAHTYAQLIDDDTRKVLLSASDMKMKKGSKTEMAKQIGAELAKSAKEKNISSVVFDRNGYQYHGRIKAVAEAAREGGLAF